MAGMYRANRVRSTGFCRGGANPELKAKHPTFNIEHPTSNDRPSAALWKFDVGRWMLDVPRVHWDGRGENSRKPSLRFDPPNSGAPPLPTCGHPLLHSKWRRGTGRGAARSLWGKADQKGPMRIALKWRQRNAAAIGANAGQCGELHFAARTIRAAGSIGGRRWFAQFVGRQFLFAQPLFCQAQ
jgi:hypothetical protein